MEQDILTERPSPVDDREEFKRRVERTSCWIDYFSMDEVLEALLEQDAVKIQQIKDVKNSCKAHCEAYLAQYDAAKDRQEKERVVGSVKHYELA